MLRAQGDTAALHHAFDTWKAGHQGSYASAAEEQQRYNTFVDNMLHVARLNNDPGRAFWVRAVRCWMAAERWAQGWQL